MDSRERLQSTDGTDRRRCLCRHRGPRVRSQLSNRKRMMSRRTRPLVLLASGLLAFLCALGATSTVQGQVPGGRTSAGGTQQPSLEEYLVSTLRATLPEQQAFIRRVVVEVEAGRIEEGFALAICRYAQRRNPSFPFPFYERAMRIEAQKRGINLPAVALIRSGRSRL